jgi:hypothetical protein
MGDIVKNIGGGWSFLVSWVLPSGLFWSVFALFVYPSVDSWPLLADISRTGLSNQSLVLAGAAILTGLLLSGLSTVLYRVLEGYYLGHGWLWRWLKASQLTKRDQLRERLRTAAAARPRDRVQEGLLRERLRRFPADRDQIGPTSFANSLRAIETYGWDRYRLDSQTLWSELSAVAPDNLRAEEEAARTPVNFSVSLLYLSIATAVMCVGTMLATGLSASLVAVGGLALALVPAWYRLAILNTRYLSAVVQAMVNLGRPALARKFGLALPSKLEDERDMWERLFWFVYEPFNPDYVADLNSYRAEPSDPDPEADQATGDEGNDPAD